jgi:HEPN domain-containing protein
MAEFDEWVQRAKLDLETAQLARQKKNLAPIVVFHCHECFEKILKALWVKHGIEIKKTHDIRLLHKNVQPHESWINEFADGLLDVHSMFGDSRYPSGDQLTHQEAGQCLRIAELFFERFVEQHPR